MEKKEAKMNLRETFEETFAYEQIYRKIKTPKTIAWIIFQAYYLWWCWLSFMCRRLGHKWEDNSYGGPDSGCIDLTCKRCGEHHHTQLY